MWALKLLLIPLFFYVAILAAIYFGQTALLFPTRMVGGQLPLPAARSLTIETPDGERLHGVHLPPRATRQGDRPLILGFGGNAWNAEAAADYLAGLYPDADIVAFHYRGYAPSTGRPSATALLSDALLVHNHVAERLRPAPIVAVGFSVGSGVAARLASRRDLAGAILVTPFDSMTRVAQRHYPWLPVGLLFRHEMPAAEDLAGSRVPVAILSASRDTIIPPARAEALAAVVPNLVYNRSIAGAGHNDLYDRAEFRQAMLEALRNIEAAGPTE